jgi:hypothetical protein
VICADCASSPTKICGEHAFTDNLVTPEELELDRERAEHRRVVADLRDAAAKAGDEIERFETAARTGHGYLQVLLSLDIDWAAINPADQHGLKAAIARIQKWADETAPWLNPQQTKGAARG